MRFYPGLLITFICLAPLTAFAQSDGRWQVIVLGGVFAPVEDDLQDTYGTGLTGKLAFSGPLGSRARLKLAADYFQHAGDPFFASDDFIPDDVGELTVVGGSLSLEACALASRYSRLYFGAGVDYVYGRETIFDDRSDGSDIGAHISFSPEFRFSKLASFVAEAHYRFLEIHFKNGNQRYQFNLSGPSLLVGLAFYLTD